MSIDDITDEQRFEVIDKVVLSLYNGREQEQYLFDVNDNCVLVVREGNVYLQYQGKEYLTDDTLRLIEQYKKDGTIKEI